jgi:hypothetical protein
MTFALVCLPALGQDESPQRENRPQRQERQDRQQRQQRISPEEAAAAWEMQADGVAKRIGLTDEQTAQLTKAYFEARKSFASAMQAQREKAREAWRAEREARREGRGDAGRRGAEGGRRGGQFPAAAMNRELITTEREKLRTAMSGFLSEEQVAEAAKSLGSFDTSWDTMAYTIAGFELGPEKEAASLGHIETYVIAMAEVRASDDRQSMMTATRDARQGLFDKLGEVLSEEQISTFRRSAMRRGTPGTRANFMDRLREFDANGDGKIEKDELPERMQGFFDRLDTNGDGVIDAEEMKAMQNRRGSRGEGRGGDIF